MPDPWLTDEELKAHEEEVANHPLTEEAKALADQEEELAKEAEERARAYAEETSVSGVDAIKPAQDTGYSAQVASGGVGPLGEGAPAEPAGNADSVEPTQAEQEQADEEEKPKASSRKKS